MENKNLKWVLWGCFIFGIIIGSIVSDIENNRRNKNLLTTEQCQKIIVD